MKKDFRVKTWLMPMPVLMVGSYDESGVANVMTAAWGGTGSEYCTGPSRADRLGELNSQ